MGCRTVRPQHELQRIARRPDGTLSASRTAPGRGAWLCLPRPDEPGAGGVVSESCLDLAARRKAFERAFQAPVAQPLTIEFPV